MGKLGSIPVGFKEANVTYYEDIGALKSAKFAKEAELTAERLASGYLAADSLLSTIRAVMASSEEEPEAEEEVAEEVEEQIIRLIIEEVKPEDAPSTQ